MRGSACAATEGPRVRHQRADSPQPQSRQEPAGDQHQHQRTVRGDPRTAHPPVHRHRPAPPPGLQDHTDRPLYGPGHPDRRLPRPQRQRATPGATETARSPGQAPPRRVVHLGCRLRCRRNRRQGSEGHHTGPGPSHTLHRTLTSAPQTIRGIQVKIPHLHPPWTPKSDGSPQRLNTPAVVVILVGCQRQAADYGKGERSEGSLIDGVSPHSVPLWS
jgi:hypothetical protein